MVHVLWLAANLLAATVARASEALVEEVLSDGSFSFIQVSSAKSLTTTAHKARSGKTTRGKVHQLTPLRRTKVKQLLVEGSADQPSTASAEIEAEQLEREDASQIRQLEQLSQEREEEILQLDQAREQAERKGSVQQAAEFGREAKMKRLSLLRVQDFLGRMGFVKQRKEGGAVAKTGSGKRGTNAHDLAVSKTSSGKKGTLAHDSRGARGLSGKHQALASIARANSKVKVHASAHAISYTSLNSTLEEPRARKLYAADWKTGRHSLVFVHIPKNAGTAIEEAGAKAQIWWPRKWVSFWHGVDMPDQSSCEKYHVPPHYLWSIKEKDAGVFTDDNTFCVTRNPYDRAVSEYLYMLEKPWGPSMSDMYSTGLLDKPACTAEGLNHFLQTAVRKVMKGSKYIHDCHFVPQSEFIWGPDRRRWCRHILRAENLAEEFNTFMQRHGYLARLNNSKKTNNSTRVCGGNITTDSLSMQTRRLLDEAYADDFEKLGYKRTQRPMVFMEIPKNTAPAMEEVVDKLNVVHPKNLLTFKHRRPMPDYSWCDRYHVPPDLLPRSYKKLFDDAEVLCFTRDPYERAIAEYKLLLSSKDGQRESEYYGVGLTAVGKVCSAKQMNFFVRRTIQLMEVGQPFALDCRMVPQTQYIWGKDGKQWCKHIIRSDMPPDAFNELMAEQGYKDINVKKAPVFWDQNSKCPHLTKASLDRGTREMLNRYYKKDFELLGFRMIQ